MSLEQSVASVLERQTDRFYGKYRGLVAKNVDPQNQGRLQAWVPEVLGTIPSNWCLPCTPYAGSGFPAGLFTIPPVLAGVWIEFEAGDVNRPIWSGCWWGKAQIPLNEEGEMPQSTSKVWRTDTGLMIALNDASNTITFKDGLESNRISMHAGIVQVQGKTSMVLEAPQIKHGQNAAEPAVLGNQLLSYLKQIVLMFNNHTHPGQVAGGMLQVTPFPPLPPMPQAPQSLISTKNVVE